MARSYHMPGIGLPSISTAFVRWRRTQVARTQVAAPKWRERWLEKRQQELLPVPYHHLVFTVPHLLNPLFLTDPKTLYSLLFRTTADTLLEIAEDPKHLGAKIGFLAILHSWSSNLGLHPHT